MKLSERLREALRSRHYSRRTEETYISWVKRFLYFHNLRHPNEMAEDEINKFLSHLALKEKVSASTQNQALSALLFLYRFVLKKEVGKLDSLIRARKPRRLPVVMTIKRRLYETFYSIFLDNYDVAYVFQSGCIRKYRFRGH